MCLAQNYLSIYPTHVHRSLVTVGAEYHIFWLSGHSRKQFITSARLNEIFILLQRNEYLSKVFGV